MKTLTTTTATRITSHPQTERERPEFYRRRHHHHHHRHHLIPRLRLVQTAPSLSPLCRRRRLNRQQQLAACPTYWQAKIPRLELLTRHLASSTRTRDSSNSNNTKQTLQKETKQKETTISELDRAKLDIIPLCLTPSTRCSPPLLPT